MVVTTYSVCVGGSNPPRTAMLKTPGVVRTVSAPPVASIFLLLRYFGAFKVACVIRRAVGSNAPCGSILLRTMFRQDDASWESACDLSSPLLYELLLISRIFVGFDYHTCIKGACAYVL